MCPRNRRSRRCHDRRSRFRHSGLRCRRSRWRNRRLRRNNGCRRLCRRSRSSNWCNRFRRNWRSNHRWSCRRRRNRFRCNWSSRCNWRWRRRRFHPRSPCSSFFRCFFRNSRCFRLRFFFRLPLNLFADFLRHIHRNRARVRLLFRHTVPGQKVDNRLCLYFQFAGQLVNSDLICVVQDFASSGFSTSPSSGAGVASTTAS
jgi:hypothetical protein